MYEAIIKLYTDRACNKLVPIYNGAYVLDFTLSSKRGHTTKRKIYMKNVGNATAYGIRPVEVSDLSDKVLFNTSTSTLEPGQTGYINVEIVINKSDNITNKAEFELYYDHV